VQLKPQLYVATTDKNDNLDLFNHTVMSVIPFHNRHLT
jgi:hypothetical protein